MRLSKHRLLALCSRAVPVAVLALSGCGSEEAPKAPAVASSASGSGASTTPDSAGGEAISPETEYRGIAEDGTITPDFKPFELDLKGDVEYEQPASAAPAMETSFPEESSTTTAPAIANLPGPDDILGLPLVIKGEIVPFEEVKKQLCLGALGEAEVAEARLNIFIEEERKRLRSIGAPPERMGLSEGELDDYLTAVENDLKTEYPEGDIDMEDVFKSLATDDPRAKLQTQLEFSRLYLPDNPADFPPLTVEAILKSEGGQSIIDLYKQSYEARQSSDGPVERDPSQLEFDKAIVQQILAHLIDSAVTLYEPEPGVLYRINGVDIKVDDVWNRIKSRVTTIDVLQAKQWIVNTRLLQAAFVEAGAWLSDDEATAAYFEHSDPYRDSIFSMERIALMVKQFPSIEYYKKYHRLYESFRRMRNPSKEQLDEFAERRTNKIVGQVAVDVDVILCSAFDFKTNTWKDNGWLEAEKRMRDVVNLLVEEQRPWDELMDRYSEFYQPSTPVSQRGLTQPDPSALGRFRNIQRNNLSPALGESDYGTFLSGSSVTDFVFFEQAVNTLGQPMRGPFGWYLPRLLRRTKPPRRLPMDENTLDERILDDYLTTELAAYAQQLIAKNEVYGLELPGAQAR